MPMKAVRSDRGSVTLLVPVGVLVLVILAAITVDLTLIGSAQHAIRYAAASAADDAASQVDEQAIRASGNVTIDMDRARKVATASLEAADLPGTLVGQPVVELVRNGTGVQVTAAIDVPHVFGRAVPGVPDTERIQATTLPRSRSDDCLSAAFMYYQYMSRHYRVSIGVVRKSHRRRRGGPPATQTSRPGAPGRPACGDAGWRRQLRRAPVD